eukprot:m.24563 g.24563  ORF g.24563 m.24563 type:complete len:145 (+) comp6089_c1_seq1:1598-2032(+)
MVLLSDCVRYNVSELLWKYDSWTRTPSLTTTKHHRNGTAFSIRLAAACSASDDSPCSSGDPVVQGPAPGPSPDGMAERLCDSDANAQLHAAPHAISADKRIFAPLTSSNRFPSIAMATRHINQPAHALDLGISGPRCRPDSLGK